MRAFFITFNFLCSLSLLFAQGVKQGDVAPILVLSETLKGPSVNEISLEKLKGKVVVLDFWATWCAPCIKEFSVINNLAAEFKDRDVVFISVSVDEGPNSKSKINSLLSKRPLNTWVVRADDKSITRNLYGASALPYIVVIDKAGVVANIITQGLNKEIIDNLLNKNHTESAIDNGKINMGAQMGSVMQGGKAKNEPVPVLSVSVNEVLATGNSIVFNKPTEIGLVGGNVQKVMQWLYGLPPSAVVMEDNLGNKSYDVSVKFQNKQISGTIKQYLKNIIPLAMGLAVKEEEREVETYVLQCPSTIKKGKQAELVKAADNGRLHLSSSGDGFLSASFASMSEILRLIQNSQGITVVDETNLEGKYDMQVNFKEEDIRSFTENLLDAGLVLKKEMRKMKAAIVKNNQ